MRDDVLEVLKRDAGKSHQNAAVAVAAMVDSDEKPLRALSGQSKQGDCIGLLTPRRLLIGGGGIDRAYDLLNLATAVVVPTSARSVFFPVSKDGPADMFYVGADGAEFAAETRAQLARLRPPPDDAPIWERPDFTHVVRLEDAGLLVAPKKSLVAAGQVVIVTASSVGVQIRPKEGGAGAIVRWPTVVETRVEGVEQVQMRPSVGAVLAFGVLGLAARRTEKRAYLILQTTDGEYLIEDGSHLPVELRALLAPFGMSDKVTPPPNSTTWQYRRLVGDDDEALWAQLDDLGRQGWELVSALGSANRLVLILKMPIAYD